MGDYITLFLGVLILIPILYVLPVRINKKIRMQLAIASLLLAALGVFMQSLFMWWQTSLILLLLAGLFAYFIGKRNREGQEEFILASNEGSGGGFYDEQGETIRVDQDPMGLQLGSDSSEMTAQSKLEETLEFDEFLPEEKQIDVPEVTQVAMKEEGTQTKDIPSNPFVENEAQYIEELMNENSTRSSLLILETEEEPFEQPLNTKERLEAFEVLEEWNKIDLDDDEGVEVEGEKISEVQGEEELEDGELELGVEAEVSLVLSEEHDPIESIENNKDTEEATPVKEIPGDPRLRSQILNSMLEQLTKAEEMMEEEAFEAFAKAHLVSSLPDLDYYVFASVLRNFYIQTKNYRKLHLLLISLQERYQGYEALNQEIEYFLEEINNKY
ncbi:hypothetical protein [Ammoniphilus sp. CFH 90114]|uniref:hypothetical protein n=1 Tax=Ammoniphilus sp. CFH 90114 TaxID=2493665 RepID=UPI0013E9679F|nr:hypothetical protein [Ammoniphilus sp. CFH 90114]